MNNEKNLNSYEISDSYQLMNERPANLHVFNRLGLEVQPDFKVVENPCQSCAISTHGPNIPGFTYPTDGRTKDCRGMETVLDRPATSGFVGNFMKDTYYRDYKNYTNSYKNYSDMNNAQITYYVDHSISQPFFEPVYTLSSNVDKTLFIDPMDSAKPQYYKTPVSTTLNSVVADQFARDQLSFRENLMASQSSKYNRTSWTNRFASPME
jgi:hypothetical protein